MPFEQMPEGSDEVIRGTDVLGKGTSKCKDPEAEGFGSPEEQRRGQRTVAEWQGWVSSREG